MAIEQALVSARNFLFIPKLSLMNTKIPSVTLNPLSSPHFFPSPSKLKFRRFRYSNDYKDNQNGYNQAVYPKPPEIQWNKELTNSVHLIGIVGTPIEIKHLPSGKALAWTRLAVKKSATDTTWVNLTFWDELAHVASQHIEKGQQIYVSGRLVSDKVESDDGKQQIYYKVVVQQLNLVEKSVPSGSLYERDSNSMTGGRKFGNNAASNMSATELWQAFFANPVDWWDNRKNKRSPNYPDFKHKDTGEALWIEGKYNPPWVKSQLAILDTRMGSLHDHDARMHDFSPF